MKVAISGPGRISRAADQAARRMRMPRSQLHAGAVAAYLNHVEGEDVTERLDAVYGEEPEVKDSFLEKAARATLRRSRW